MDPGNGLGPLRCCEGRPQETHGNVIPFLMEVGLFILENCLKSIVRDFIAAGTKYDTMLK